MPEVVFDTCVISNFALAEALGVTEDLYRGRAHIPEFVAAEIMRGIQAGNERLAAVPKAVRAGWLKETGLRSRKEKALFESLSRSLGWGEAAAIAVAKGRGFRFASDDKVARAEATRLGVPVTGTVGILAGAVRRSVCDERAAGAYLERMIDAGFFSPVRSIREVLSGGP
jgi:predicted nucleic acid-binding protein